MLLALILYLLQNQPLAYKNEKVEIARMPPRLKHNGFILPSYDNNHFFYNVLTSYFALISLRTSSAMAASSSEDSMPSI